MQAQTSVPRTEPACVIAARRRTLRTFVRLGGPVSQPFINHPLLSPVPPPTSVVAAVRRLEPFAADNTPRQHVVSKVLLGEFTERWGKSQAYELAGLDLHRVNDHP